MTKKAKTTGFKFWTLIWGLGLAGQLCWNMENQWFNTFVYEKIAKDPTIISWMVAISSAATTLSTFIAGTHSDRKGRRRTIVAVAYIMWGLFTIAFGTTQYITNGQAAPSATLMMVAAVAVVSADAIMSFFGSMGNDSGFNAWVNDHMTDKNRGQIGAALATQPVIGTIVGTVVGGMLVGSDNNYMRLFIAMGGFVILCGVFALIFMKDAPDLEPHVDGSFWHQFASVFNFKRYFSLKELVWVNLTFTAYFVAFNMYFTHLGNYLIYYLGFTADQMGLIEGLALICSMVMVFPATALINRNRTPLVCVLSVIANIIGLAILSYTAIPGKVDTGTILNWPMLIGVFFIGVGYIVIMQALTVWSKKLYPSEAKGQFEGVRILFFVMLPMCIAPIISNPIIKASGEFVNDYGITEYLPNEILLKVSALISLITFIPLGIASYYHNKRIKAEAAALEAAAEAPAADEAEETVVEAADSASQSAEAAETAECAEENADSAEEEPAEAEEASEPAASEVESEEAETE